MSFRNKEQHSLKSFFDFGRVHAIAGLIVTCSRQKMNLPAPDIAVMLHKNTVLSFDMIPSYKRTVSLSLKIDFILI